MTSYIYLIDPGLLSISVANPGLLSISLANPGLTPDSPRTHCFMAFRVKYRPCRTSYSYFIDPGLLSISLANPGLLSISLANPGLTPDSLFYGF